MENLSVNISIREEQMNNKKVFIINNEETGISDFGDTLDEAMNNFRKAMNLFLETYPKKKELFIENAKEPVMISRILL